eukprot:6195667-Pleurochrysis_carterae.AAC.1
MKQILSGSARDAPKEAQAFVASLHGQVLDHSSLHAKLFRANPQISHVQSPSRVHDVKNTMR